MYSELLESVRTIPGVRSATMGNVSPTRPDSGCCGYVDLETGALSRIQQVMVYPDYFETLGLPLAAGRDFDSGDFRSDSAPVVVINETWARMRFQDEDPVGQALGTGNSATIIGVVRDVRYTSLRRPTPPMYYAPFLTAGTGRGQMILHVRAAGSAESILEPVRRAMGDLDPNVPQFAIHTLSEEIDAVLVEERLIGMLSGLFSALALILWPRSASTA